MKNKEIAKRILLKLTDQGYQAYLVGGFVRDMILGRTTTDIDIATDAKPETVMVLFDKAIPTGIKHGTVTVIEEGFPIEITTFRKEGKYLDFRHPIEVEFVANLYDDLSRRDFTMNAIAMDKDGQFIDPFQGKNAIQKQKIESVGNPNDRFLEDPLRMLRAVRFASQLSFFIEEHTQNAIYQLAPYLQYIAIERVKIEFDKIMNSHNPELGLRLLFFFRLDQCLKEMDKDLFTVINRQMVYRAIGKTNDCQIRWAILLESLNAKQRLEFMKGLRFSNHERVEIDAIFKAYSILEQGLNIENLKKCYIETEVEMCKKTLELSFLLGHIHEKERLEALTTLMNLTKMMPVRTLRDLNITGKEILQEVQKPAGPWVHHLLQKLFEQVVYHNLPNERGILIKEIEHLRGEDI
ncbi:CCA tRNA nucleotidyltransferase [Tepidibacillus marianensis]|uniref:CCA tRNA nucleotidyltransferase n=1 Tax=Tepidibacillus marianensis TaxID=3131995 RepID=UPI0030D5675F